MALPSIKNRVGMTVSGTPGTGTITLNAADTGYQSFASAYGANANVDVLIVDGAAWEVARDCTYTHSGTTVSRGTLEASSTGSALNLTSAAKVYVVSTAARISEFEKMVDSGMVFVHNTDTVGQSLTGSVFVKLAEALGTEEADPNGWWDTTNKRFQPTRAGKYLIFGHCQMGSGNGVSQAAIYKNGSSIVSGPVSKDSTSGGYLSGDVSGVVTLNGSSDYVEMYMYASPGGTTLATGTDRTTFTALYWGP